jgi:hypothetical protein
MKADPFSSVLQVKVKMMSGPSGTVAAGPHHQVIRTGKVEGIVMGTGSDRKTEHGIARGSRTLIKNIIVCFVKFGINTKS